MVAEQFYCEYTITAIIYSVEVVLCAEPLEIASKSPSCNTLLLENLIRSRLYLNTDKLGDNAAVTLVPSLVTVLGVNSNNS